MSQELEKILLDREAKKASDTRPGRKEEFLTLSEMRSVPLEKRESLLRERRESRKKDVNLPLAGSVYDKRPYAPSNEDAASKQMREKYQYNEPLDGWGDTPYHLRFKQQKPKK